MGSDKVTVPDLTSRKPGGARITVVTAYDATFARLFDAAGVDALLVGDSLGMVIQGHANTLPVTLDEICYHGRAVARATTRAHIIGDLPFLSYQVSVPQAIESAGRLLKDGGCESVKLEGGAAVVAQVAAIVAAGIPVMGHLGLTPQSVHAFGGFRVQGRGEPAEQRLLEDALALEQAGAFAIVLESIPPNLAARVTAALRIPTIGIGAGPACDGQVLVGHDLLGLETRLRPRFVKRFAELGAAVTSAARAYVDEVRAGTFPAEEHCFSAVATPKPSKENA